jgi:hypothetical protein
MCHVFKEISCACIVYPLAENNNMEEGNHMHKNDIKYKEEPGQVQKMNYIDWTSG